MKAFIEDYRTVIKLRRDQPKISCQQIYGHMLKDKKLDMVDQFPKLMKLRKKKQMVKKGYRQTKGLQKYTILHVGAGASYAKQMKKCL